MTIAPYYDDAYKKRLAIAIEERDKKIADIKNHEELSDDEKEILIAIVKGKHLGLID